MKALLFTLMTGLLSSSLADAAVEPIRYTLRFPAPQTHYVEVEAEYPTAGRSEVDLTMAVWTPGSYLVREYSRNVEDVQATAPALIEKTTKNHWHVRTNGAAVVKVRYKVYAREMSVRTNWIESGFALLNGAATYLTLHEQTARPHEVRVELPAAWKTSISGLPSPNGNNRFWAADYDTLVDSPILAGNPVIGEFEVDGKKHYLVNEGDPSLWDTPRAARDVARIVQEFRRMWGSLPYDKYVFFNLITEAGGGLEHKNSTVLMTNRWAMRTRAGYVGDPLATPPRGGWLGLASHEFFHVWNVKRLRPAELGPFDYENEVYTRSLWISEGFTSYYGDLGVRRAGFFTNEEYLAELGRLIEALQTTPGRLLQSAEQSSFDAWIKQYRPDENSPNTTISYYTKGGVLGFLLDAHLRKLTNGARNLDDLMRLAYQRYSGAKGFTPEQFEQTAAEVAGTDLRTWWTRHVQSTEELDYTEALQWFGLRFAPEEAPRPGREEKAWLGALTKIDNGRTLITQVKRDTPAFAAGLNVDDELLGIDDYRVRADQWAARLGDYRPGDQVTLLIARRDRLIRMPLRLGREPGKRWRLQPDPAATPEQKQHLQQWLQPANS